MSCRAPLVAPQETLTNVLTRCTQVFQSYKKTLIVGKRDEIT